MKNSKEVKTVENVKVSENAIVNSAASTIEVRNKTFNARRNEIYRAFFSNDAFEVETKKQVFAELDSMNASYTIVNNVAKYIKASKKDKNNSAVLTQRLKAACKFNASADKDLNVHVSYTVKQVMQAAKALIADIDNDKSTVAIESDKLADMIKSSANKLKTAKEKLSEVKEKLSTIAQSDSDYREVLLTEKSNLITSIEKSKAVKKFLTEKKASLNN